MHDIEKYVAKFKKEFRIRSLPTLADLEAIIENKLFYKLLTYQGNEALFFSLTKNPDIKCRTAVALRIGDERYVFYNKNIPPQDRAYIFAHEIAHIYIGHYSRDDGYMDTSYRKEREANSFATLLFLKSKRRIGTSILCTATAFLLVLLFLFTHIFEIDKNILTVSTASIQTSTRYSVTCTLKKSVMVTTSGKKYHKEDCVHIQNRNSLKTLSIFEALLDGYTPCSNCF